MAKGKTNGFSFRKGSRLYPFSYALSAMRSYPFRALSLALTLSLGVSLIGSVLIWADTGVTVSVDGYFDDNSFQLMVSGDVGETQAIGNAEEYAKTSEFVDSAYRVNSTVGLVYGTNLPGTTSYGLEKAIYSDGIKDCQVIFVNNEFLNIVESEFEIEGRFALEAGEIVVSQLFVESFYEVYGFSVTINSTIDIELLTRRTTSVAPISTLDRVSLTTLRVVGIYEIMGYDSIIEAAFPSILRSNYKQYNLDTPVLGIRDSVLILSSAINTAPLPSSGFFPARSFLRASSTALVNSGVDNIADNLLTLKDRISELYDVEVEGLDEVMYLQSIVDTYTETMPLALLNLPIFILALFLSVFAADTFMATRKVEVSALRAKGASSNQIYWIFFSESIVIASISLFFGILLSIAFSALIPSVVSFMIFDWSAYLSFLYASVVRPETIVYVFLFCILPPLLFILNTARSTSKTEIGSGLVESSEALSEGKQAYGFTIGMSVVLLSMVLGAVIFFPADPIMLLLELGLGTASWFFMAYNGSRISRLGFARVTQKLSFILGEKNLVAAGNLRMRRGRIVPLMVVLALTMSSTIAFTVQAESFQADLNMEISYAIGADLRVDCTSRGFAFNDTLEEYPGVNRATPVLRTSSSLGVERITLTAVDAIEYSLIGDFDDTSFEGETYSTALSKLASVENGIILSRYHAERWNKTVGDSITMEVNTRGDDMDVTFEIVALVYSAPAFGYAAAEYIPPSRLGPGFGYQTGLAGFALTNLEFVSSVTDMTVATLFLADLVCVTDEDLVLRALNDLPGVTATTPDSFDLESTSFGTALFLSTVQGLFSIGFAMSLLLSMFALTLFLGSIVRERKRDYAILRAVGGSKQQIVKLVLSEFTGVVLAALTLSLILGTIFGFVQSVVIFTMSPFARTLQALIVFPVGFLTGVLLLEVFMMILGSYWPAREASKTDPAIVLRNL
ncbi:MAG: FtsX-like permease family protein [Candidatus Lokiarchaeota archaeon]|nr:FtsX-like permease family protein [Candidatus Lokiarchaeota archaeon]